MPEPEAPYYRYTDDSGATVWTDRLDAVPRHLRERAEPVRTPGDNTFDPDLRERAREWLERAREAAEGVRERADPHLGDVHLPSAALGFGVGLGVFFAFSIAFKTGRLLFRLVLFLVVIGVIGGSSYWVVESGGDVSGRLIRDVREALDAFESNLPGAE
jgi:hypothetical protein